MNYNIVWIGKYQESMNNFGIFGSISKFGIEKFNHFVFNHLLYSSYNDYLEEKIYYFIYKDRNIKFYFYDQSLFYEINKRTDIKNHVICVNSENILTWLNNKSITREWIRNIVKTPETIVLSRDEIKVEYLKNIFWGYKKFVAQKMVSSGGHKTFLIDQANPYDLENDLYIVSPYYESSLSVNITSIINPSMSITFPVSLQIIEDKNRNLLYKGSDFIAAKTIPQNLLEKLLNSNKRILENLNFLGYRGICGIDFLLHNDEVYFLEINPRFQGSSFLIDKALKRYQLSLYKLNIELFYNQIEANIVGNITKINVPYSFRKNSDKRVIMNTEIITSYPENLSTDYYDYFADKYYIMLKNWKDKINQQGKILKSILEKYSKNKVMTILDCTCGIGIQAISLAQEGFIVVGSDLSQNELDFATEEARKRNLDINFLKADCRYLEKSIDQKFDAIISIDSALPHLLTKENFLLAFQSIYQRLNEGGVFLSSYRDYEALLETKPNMAYPVRFNSENNIEYTILRKWKWEGEHIYSKQYVIADSPSESKLYTSTYKQWAITKNQLLKLVQETDYSECYWLLPENSGFSQPILCLVK